MNRKIKNSRPEQLYFAFYAELECSNRGSSKRRIVVSNDNYNQRVMHVFSDAVIGGDLIQLLLDFDGTASVDTLTGSINRGSD